jgi:hypothetical protein
MLTSFYVIDSTILVKSFSSLQLSTDSAQLHLGIAVVSET